MLKFPWDSDKLFDTVFMFVTSLSILWIRSVLAACGNPTGHGIQFQGMGILLNYLCQRSELIWQSIGSLAMLNGNHVDV